VDLIDILVTLLVFPCHDELSIQRAVDETDEYEVVTAAFCAFSLRRVYPMVAPIRLYSLYPTKDAIINALSAGLFLRIFYYSRSGFSVIQVAQSRVE